MTFDRLLLGLMLLPLDLMRSTSFLSSALDHFLALSAFGGIVGFMRVHAMLIDGCGFDGSMEVLNRDGA